MITIDIVVRSWTLPLILLALSPLAACTTSGQQISAQAIEEKISALRLGQSTKTDVERILGAQHSADGNRWAYNYTDSAFDISERKQGPASGIFPVRAGVAPTNTRAVITVVFDDSMAMKRLEIARFFGAPFVNDYWYRLKDSPKEPLQSIATLGEAAGMKAVGLENGAVSFTLEDPITGAKITVKLEGTTLRLTSHNPHHRLGSEYRVYTKRESALAERIANSDFVH